MFEISISGIKKVTLKEKYDVFFIYLDVQHRKPKLIQ